MRWSRICRHLVVDLWRTCRKWFLCRGYRSGIQFWQIASLSRLKWELGPRLGPTQKGLLRSSSQVIPKWRWTFLVTLATCCDQWSAYVLFPAAWGWMRVTRELLPLIVYFEALSPLLPTFSKNVPQSRTSSSYQSNSKRKPSSRSQVHYSLSLSTTSWPPTPSRPSDTI